MQRQPRADAEVRLEETLRLLDALETSHSVNGHRALVLDYSSDPSFPLASVMWSTTPGLTIEASIRGTVDDALALARSVVEVDRATWESSTDPPYVDPLGHDGCWRSDVFGC